MSRLSKPLPYPYVNIFENKECISENVSDIQSYVKKTPSEDRCNSNSSLFIAVIVLLLIENNRSVIKKADG